MDAPDERLVTDMTMRYHDKNGKQKLGVIMTCLGQQSWLRLPSYEDYSFCDRYGLAWVALDAMLMHESVFFGCIAVYVCHIRSGRHLRDTNRLPAVDNI